MGLLQIIILLSWYIQRSNSQITFPRTTGSPVIQINSSSSNYIGILFDSADEFNWYGAQDYCQYYFNTSLATVQSSTDWNEIYDLAVQMNDVPLPQGDGAYMWIGYSANSNGNLVWAPCHNINSNCLYDPCEANCDVYADDWVDKAREASFSADLCGYIERAGTTKNWFDGTCDLVGKDLICNSPYGKYKTDISCDDNGDKDIEYTTEEFMDIQCGSFLPRVTDHPILQFNSSSLNYVGIVSDGADEIGWYYAQEWCRLIFNTSLATVQSKQDWNEIYDLAEQIDGLGGAQADGLYLWIGFKSNSDKNIVWAPCHDSIYDNCTYDPCEANCDAYADDWVNKDREASFGGDLCGYIQRGSTAKQWYDAICDGKKDFICNSPYGKYKHDILCTNNGLLDNEYSEEPGWDISCDNPTVSPTNHPSINPTLQPTIHPTINPTLQPTPSPTNVGDTQNPTETPTDNPTFFPTESTNDPTVIPTVFPTGVPSKHPTQMPTVIPSKNPTQMPTVIPSKNPTQIPSDNPTKIPSKYPTRDPSKNPTTVFPSLNPTENPSESTTEDVGEVAETTDSSLATDSVGFNNNVDNAMGMNMIIIIISAGCGLMLCILIIIFVVRLRRRKNKQILNNETNLELEKVKSVSTGGSSIGFGTDNGEHTTNGLSEDIPMNTNDGDGIQIRSTFVVMDPDPDDMNTPNEESEDDGSNSMYNTLDDNHTARGTRGGFDDDSVHNSVVGDDLNDDLYTKPSIPTKK